MSPQGNARLGMSLVGGMAAGTFVHSALVALGPSIVEHFGIAPPSFGLVITVYFLVGMVASPAVGWVADGLGLRTGMVGLFALSGVAVALLAWSPTSAWLFAGAAVGGLATAASNPVTNNVVLASVTSGHRGTMIALKQSGVQFGALAAGGALPPIAAVWGWRAALLAGLALPLAGAWATSVPRRAGHPPPASVQADAAGSPGAARNGLPGLLACGFLIGVGMSAMTVYVPLYAYHVLGFTAVAAGMLIGLMGLLGMFSRFLWARVTERSGRAVRSLVTIGMLSSAGVLAIAVSPAVRPAVWVGVALVASSAAAWNAVAMVAVIRSPAGPRVGRASGAVMGAFFGGFVVGPVLAGRVLDATGSYRPIWLSVCLLFALSAAAVLLPALRSRATEERARVTGGSA